MSEVDRRWGHSLAQRWWAYLAVVVLAGVGAGVCFRILEGPEPEGGGTDGTYGFILTMWALTAFVLSAVICLFVELGIQAARRTMR